MKEKVIEYHSIILMRWKVATGNWTFHICILVPVCHTQKNTFPNGESDRVGLGGFLPSIYRLCNNELKSRLENVRFRNLNER